MSDKKPIELKFNKNGKFKVLQMADLQDSTAVSVDTLRFMVGAIDKVKPDLIVLSGDQLDVVALWSVGDKHKNVERALRDLLSPIESAGIPFAATFGNHDDQMGVSKIHQAEIYDSHKYNVGFENFEERGDDPATFNLPILSSDGKKTALNFYMIDSNSYPESGDIKGYDNVHSEQIEWYRQKREQLREANGGEYVPSVVVQHIPVIEIYDVMKEVHKNTFNAKVSFRERKGRYFIPDKDKLLSFDTYREAPSVPDINSGEFEALSEKGDVFLMSFGHDHYNCFHSKHPNGMDLCYTPGAGFNSYGLNPRIMRVFEFDEKNVRDYKTTTVNYDEVCGKILTQPVKNFIYKNAPESLNAAIPFITKVLIVLLFIISCLVVVEKFLFPGVVPVLLLSLACVGAVYGVFSFFYNRALRKKLLKEIRNKNK